MTLKEKLQEEQPYINAHTFKLTKESLEKFEKIADKHAIDFAEWLTKSYYLRPGYEKLLEFFKKEKGL